jgi:hypothetical protein
MTWKYQIIYSPLIYPFIFQGDCKDLLKWASAWSRKVSPMPLENSGSWKLKVSEEVFWSGGTLGHKRVKST